MKPNLKKLTHKNAIFWQLLWYIMVYACLPCVEVIKVHVQNYLLFVKGHVLKIQSLWYQ